MAASSGATALSQRSGRGLCVGAMAIMLALTGCENAGTPEKASANPEAPAGTGSTVAGNAFVHSAQADLSGYYLPVSEVAIGSLRLDHIFLGQAFEFEAWESGEISPTFAPVMLQFDDVSSPMVATELGEAHSVSVRVLPTRYSVTEDAIRFAGRSDDLGAVSFNARLDQEALATARRNLGDEGAVLTGTLVAGGRTFDDVRFHWYGGD